MNQTNKVKELLYTVDDKRILHTMTNDEWQQYFEILQTMIKPTKEKKLTRHGTHIRVVNRYWSLSKSNDDGNSTLDKRYVDYINDILKVIRGKRNKVDHCYRIYQIAELLRFEPDLKTRLVHKDGMDYFEVWL